MDKEDIDWLNNVKKEMKKRHKPKEPQIYCNLCEKKIEKKDLRLDPKSKHTDGFVCKRCYDVLKNPDSILEICGIMFLILIFLIGGIVVVESIKKSDFCQERGYKYSTFGNDIEKGYIECYGRYNNHKYDGTLSQIFKLENEIKNEDFKIKIINESYNKNLTNICNKNKICVTIEFYANNTDPQINRIYLNDTK